MNKVLVTGLGTASELGICETCNLDFSWLLHNPSTLLWADQICIPKHAYEKARIADTSKTEKVINVFLNMTENEGIINRVDLAEMYQKGFVDRIYEKMLNDSQVLLDTFPNDVKKGDERVPDEIIIENQGYCGAWMASIYMGIKAANDLDANCLFGRREHIFLKYLYGLNAKNVSGYNVNKAYNEVFSIYMPESLGIHQYGFIPEDQCKVCENNEKCKENYLEDTQYALQKILSWRNYDEIQQAKAEIDKIITIKGQISSQKDIDDIIKKFKERQEIINKNINKRFPQIQRWTKMTTVLATPITIASAITGNVPLTIGGAVATGVAQATENLMEIYKSKNNWVGFVNSMKNM